MQLFLDLPDAPASFQAVRRWERDAPARYYLAWLHTDLLGDLVLSTAWGGKGNRLGSTAQTVLPSLIEAIAALEKLDQTRRRHGYRPVPVDTGAH